MKSVKIKRYVGKSEERIPDDCGDTYWDSATRFRNYDFCDVWLNGRNKRTYETAEVRKIYGFVPPKLHCSTITLIIEKDE